MTAYTNRGAKWELASSWWVLLTIVPFGLTSFIAFFYAGGMTSNRRWTIYGFAYLTAFIVALITTAAGVGLAIAIAAWIISIVHAFKIRPAFLVQLDVRLQNKKALDYEKVMQLRKEAESFLQVKQPLPPNMSDAKIKNESPPNSYNKESDSDKVRNELSDTLDALSRRTSLVSEEVNAESPKFHVKLDVNHATEADLASIPEIGIILAKKIVLKRQELGGFESFVQFKQLMNIREQAASRLEEQLVFASAEEPEVKEELKQGRRIDF